MHVWPYARDRHSALGSKPPLPVALSAAKINLPPVLTAIRWILFLFWSEVGRCVPAPVTVHADNVHVKPLLVTKALGAFLAAEAANGVFYGLC